MSCTPTGDEVALSSAALVPDVPVPPADGPQLGAIAHATPIRQRPGRDAAIVGYMHAGARVARAEKPYSDTACEGGWYPVRPRGFVCLDEGATLDLRHPTLATMAIQPDVQSPLPYAYARTSGDADVYAVDDEHERRVRREREMTSHSGVAIVGSWEASVSDTEPTLRLAMMTNGRFLDASRLTAAQPSDFQGVQLGEQQQLPVGFIVKRGIGAWALSGIRAERTADLPYHRVIPLTGKQREVRGLKYWEAQDGSWVRHRDMTTARRRSKLPAFVTETTRWVDVSIIAGTLVAYEGHEPVFATLVSVGADRLSDGLPDAHVTRRGEFPVVAKHTSALNANVRGFANRVEIHDAPWTLELASGQLLHGAYWHDKFGVEHGPGNLQLAPADALWLWHWVTPDVPAGWHAVVLGEDEFAKATIINIRK